jgi:cytochrome P450
MTAEVEQRQWTVPGPQPLPVVGRTLNVARFGLDSVGYGNHLFRAFGPVAALAAGGRTNLYSPATNCPGSVIAYGPDIVREVATQHHVYHKCPLSGTLYRQRHKSERTKALKTFGVGLFGVNEETHLQQRKLMAPAFHKQGISHYRDHMVAIAQSEIDALQVDHSCEISQFMQRLTLRIATQTLFGEDINASDQTVGELLQDIITAQLSPLTRLLPIDIPGLPFANYLSLLAKYEQKMQAIISQKRAKGDGDLDVLSMLIHAHDQDSGESLSEDELIGHAGVIFLAGHETTANTLTWTLFLLSQHPQVAADLLDELATVLQGEPPTVEQLQHLPLLERVIKESMRVVAAVPWNGRVTAQDTELGGYTLPKGTEVFVSIYHTHQMPDLYLDPTAFKPQRWETLDPSIYEFNPFSAGPRLCIGAAFALMELKIVLAMLLQHFRWELLPEQVIDRKGLISLKPKFGLNMKVHAQDRQFSDGVGGVQGNIREMVQLP